MKPAMNKATTPAVAILYQSYVYILRKKSKSLTPTHHIAFQHCTMGKIAKALSFFAVLFIIRK